MRRLPSSATWATGKDRAQGSDAMTTKPKGNHAKLILDMIDSGALRAAYERYLAGLVTT